MLVVNVYIDNLIYADIGESFLWFHACGDLSVHTNTFKSTFANFVSDLCACGEGLVNTDSMLTLVNFVSDSCLQ